LSFILIFLYVEESYYVNKIIQLH